MLRCKSFFIFWTRYCRMCASPWCQGNACIFIQFSMTILPYYFRKRDIMPVRQVFWRSAETACDTATSIAGVLEFLEFHQVAIHPLKESQSSLRQTCIYSRSPGNPRIPSGIRTYITRVLEYRYLQKSSIRQPYSHISSPGVPVPRVLSGSHTSRTGVLEYWYLPVEFHQVAIHP